MVDLVELRTRLYEGTSDLRLKFSGYQHVSILNSTTRAGVLRVVRKVGNIYYFLYDTLTIFKEYHIRQRR